MALMAEHPGCPICNRIVTTYPRTGHLRSHNTAGRGSKPCRGSGRTRAVLQLEVEDQRRRDQEHAETHRPHGAHATVLDPESGRVIPGAQITWDGQGNMALDLADNNTAGVTGNGGGWPDDDGETRVAPMAARLLDAALTATSKLGQPGDSIDLTLGAAGDPFWEEMADAMAAQEAEQNTNGSATHPLTELERWWRDLCQQQIDVVVPKALEYSSTDLFDLGRQLAEMAGRDYINTREATELGIAFYAAGKIARIMGAVKEGRMGSYDSWLDLAIYATMAMRVHQVGAWPGTADTQSEGHDGT